MSSKDEKTKDEFSFALFKGATRPPEFKGIPYIPLMLTVAGAFGIGLITRSPIPFGIAAVIIACLYFFGRDDPRFISQAYLFVRKSGIVKLLKNQLDESYEPNRPKNK
jgi:type IV secretory pathway VirB3-like protein